MMNTKLMSATALLARNPKSKAKALNIYLRDEIGLLHNLATDEMRQELSEALANVKGRSVPAIKEICRNCVGAEFDGHCAKLIRECEIKDCFLYGVRPYQPKAKNMGGVNDGFKSFDAHGES
jgi:hypothetical protein